MQLGSYIKAQLILTTQQTFLGHLRSPFSRSIHAKSNFPAAALYLETNKTQ